MNTADDTLVYFDPDTRVVIGPVEWEGDRPKKLPREQAEGASQKAKRMYYPYCTARTAKRFGEKKHQRQEDGKLSLEEALQKAIREPFWNEAPGTHIPPPAPNPKSQEYADQKNESAYRE